MQKVFFDSSFFERKALLLIGKTLNLENMLLLKNFFNKWFSDYSYFTEIGRVGNSSFRDFFLPKNIEAPVVVFLGLNPRQENPILNIYFKKKSIEGDTFFFSLGNKLNLNFTVFDLGLNLFKGLKEIVSGKSILSKLISKKSEITFLGGDFLLPFENKVVALLDQFNKVLTSLEQTKKINFFPIYSSLSTLGLKELGLTTTKIIENPNYVFSFEQTKSQLSLQLLRCFIGDTMEINMLSRQILYSGSYIFRAKFNLFKYFW